jgi:diguanylate cyclase (GGDEF)-like protein
LILDVRTISIFSAITPLVLAFIMLVYWKERKVYGGFGHWILANFGLSVGYLFISLEGFISDFLSVFVGNCLIVYCIILIYEGIERFYHRPSFRGLNYVVLGVYIVLQFFFTYIDPNANVRVTLSSLAVFILIMLASTRLFIVSIPQLSRTSHAAGYVFLITAIFPLAHAISSMERIAQIDLFSDVLHSWFALVFTISIVTWTFYFFFLNSARLELDLETARAELELIARTDALTNLYNRRHFDEQAELEFQRAKRSGFTNSLLLLDVDEFKSINDINGHEVGDAVLITLAAVLRSELRSFDLIARYGGDEFIIMLPHTNQEQAFSIAERIRKRVGLTPFVVRSRIFNVTLSAGIATLQSDDPDLKLLLRRGDDALYRAKELGRNCVVVG